MTDADYLSPDELRALTGAKQRGAQLAWLRDNRWRHTTTRHGAIRVARAYWRHRLVGDVDAPAANDAEPDFAAVRRA